MIIIFIILVNSHLFHHHLRDLVFWSAAVVSSEGDTVVSLRKRQQLQKLETK